MIRNNLDEIMWRRKISVKDLSERTGLTSARISNIKNHPTTNITTDTVAKLCKALGIAIQDLLIFDDSEENSESKIELAHLAGF
ncbi:MAG TPA: transcriptional regulator [Herpetosiphon sp.]|uniref:helix-turn-helix domain-containing protein n=1 Tax=Herpetosiphon sp. TaxID=71864 RepID=UPI00059DCE68|nr:transcriptional regulator [Herpetosiphon sp.]